jgi:myo-inositol-1(or 4)-monophosphatase
VRELEVANEAARAGAAILLKYWETLGKEDADIKARNDWVSKADRESELAIIAILQDAFPDDAILGEEGGLSRREGKSGRMWVVDPLDGTSNYLQHFPVWSISIGLRRNEEMIAGLIHEPLRDLFFTAEKGAGAYRNGKRMSVSDQPKIEGAFLATGFPFRAQEYVTAYCSIFQDVLRVAKGVRRAGSAALDLAYTAAGIFDGFFELHLAPWDVAAGSLLVTEAGGAISDFSGGQRWFERGNIVGAPPGVHKDLLRLFGHHVSEEALDHRKANRPIPSA